jgi:hypothetical protein
VMVTPAAATPSTCQTVMKALGRYGKLLEDGTRKAADATGNIWHHRAFTFLPLLLSLIDSSSTPSSAPRSL